MSGRVLVVASIALALPIGVAGAEPASPWPEAVQEGRTASEAVISRAGSEACLQGKLTNAMLKVSDSCDVTGRIDPACLLADEFLMGPLGNLPELDEVSERFLKFTATP